jgi:hypothetical protein
MRKILFVAGAIACLSLNACEKKAEAPVAEAPKKSLARMAPLYAGQDQVASVQSGKVTVAPSGGVTLEAKATTDGGGWTDVGFLPRIYAATPPDGIYEIDIVGQKPATPGAAGPTPVEVKGAWDKYTDGRVKGVTFKTKTNDLTVKLLTAP